MQNATLQNVRLRYFHSESNVCQFSLLCFRYIVECNTDVHPPAYLLPFEKTYDLACIAAEGHKDSLKPFNPLTPTAWPAEEQLGLDDSQLQALQLALTKELAIIQGPPGTGREMAILIKFRSIDI